jgi:hypothetical protein
MKSEQHKQEKGTGPKIPCKAIWKLDTTRMGIHQYPAKSQVESKTQDFSPELSCAYL